ncbi:MAG: type II secretion system secretin GspD [Nitrospinota bacterium]
MKRILIALIPIALFIADSGAENISISGANSQSVELEESQEKLPGPKVVVTPSISGKRKTGLRVEETPSARQSRKGATTAGKSIVLNFEAAPIREVIKNICEILGMNYIIESGIGGFVTIRTLNKIPVSSALDLLDQLMSLNNIARVKIGDYWRFLPIAKGLKEPLPIYKDVPPTRFAAQDRYQIQILSFNYVSADQVVEILKPFLSESASVTPIPSSNMVLMVERGTKLQEIVTLVEAIDVDSLDSLQVKLFELKNAYADEVNQELTSIFTAMGYVKSNPGGVTFMPLDRLNAILMVNPFPNLYSSIKSWVDKLDAPPSDTAEVSTFIYQVQNGDAATLARILRQLYSPADGRKSKGIVKNTASNKNGGKKKEISAKTLPMVDNEVLIIPHAETNSIIIRTARINYQRIVETLKELDVMPLQVLIEVLVTELSLTDELEFGLEWALRRDTYHLAQNFGGLGQAGTVATNLNNPAFNQVGAAGLSFFTRPTTDVMGLVTALAQERKLDVTASPILMTSDNKTASIDITDEVPIPVTTTTTTGITRDSVQYRSVGIRLSVTPKINEERYVTLDIDQEISQINSSITSPVDNAVPLFRRQAKTSVVVKDKQTLMIGGMIREAKGGDKSGVPFLYKIPIIGWLFGANAKSTSKTELLILLTPRVVASDKEARLITEEYRKRIRDLQAASRASKTIRKRESRDEKTILN